MRQMRGVIEHGTYQDNQVMSDNEVFQITPFGLLQGVCSISDSDIHRLLDALELHLHRTSTDTTKRALLIDNGTLRFVDVSIRENP